MALSVPAPKLRLIQCMLGTPMQSRDIAQRSKESTHYDCGIDAHLPYLICNHKKRLQKVFKLSAGVKDKY